MATAVARAAQQTQEAVQAQVASQIRWIADDLPKMLKQQAEKALLQLGEFQPMDAATAAEGPPPPGMPVGAADGAPALVPGTGPKTELEAPAGPPSGASPGKNPPSASAAQPPLAEQPFWALAEPDLVGVTAASAPDDMAEQAGESASERTPLERARSDLLAAAQRAEQAQRANGGAGWEQAQAELLQAAAAVVANAGALTGTAPPFGSPGLAAAAAAAPGSVWPWSGPYGHELPPQWSMPGAMPGAMPGPMPGASVHAPPPWAAPWGRAAWGETPPWGCHPSSWPDAAHSHASQMQWAAASAAQPLRPQTATATRPARWPVTGPPPESSYAGGHAGSSAMVDDGMGTPDAGSASDVDGRAVAGKASGYRMASMLDASPRLFSPCAYSPSTFDAPAQLLAVGPGPDFDSAPSPTQADAPRGAPFADDVSADAPAAENVAASRPNFATRSKGGGFFNKNSGAAVQASSLPSPAPQQSLRRLTPCARARAPRSRSAVPPCLQSPRPPRIASAPPSTNRACWRLFRARRPQRRCHRAPRSRATRPRASEGRCTQSASRPTRRVHLALRSRRTGNHSCHPPRRHRSPHTRGMRLRLSPRPHSICSRSCHSTRTSKSEPLWNPQTAFLFLHGLGEAAVHYLGETVPMLRACLLSLHSPCIAT